MGEPANPCSAGGAAVVPIARAVAATLGMFRHIYICVMYLDATTPGIGVNRTKRPT
ncbi:MAG: hypothetical protein BIP78_0899 [Candidatus Bipolaricaulis sibiricus]|uniref:Uncharacterized protein n=1 Tax=Bipolaricaulis sibiricus TaxID=2501609 RepID=A0A410FU77_BIPS1|nr:MAG: hypothetical protein BIP78_0899 [Candidatus Bipolaricaulis sibiricus]